MNAVPDLDWETRFLELEEAFRKLTQALESLQAKHFQLQKDSSDKDRCSGERV